MDTEIVQVTALQVIFDLVSFGLDAFDVDSTINDEEEEKEEEVENDQEEEEGERRKTKKAETACSIVSVLSRLLDSEVSFSYVCLVCSYQYQVLQFKQATGDISSC